MGLPTYDFGAAPIIVKPKQTRHHPTWTPLSSPAGAYPTPRQNDYTHGAATAWPWSPAY